MMYRLFLIIALLFSPALYAQQTADVSGVVRDNAGVLENATVILKNSAQQYVAVTNNSGKFLLKNVKPGSYTLTVKFVGFSTYTKTIQTPVNKSLDIVLTEDKELLGEVIVTATESRGVTSASRINRQAMVHLQPSSFTDLLELLPGNISKDPVSNQSNIIRLREASEDLSNRSDKYTMSALGTSFVIDGTPINSNANMQYVSGATSSNTEVYYRNTVNQGVDMRTISTDQIESVEVVRGIASAEYGDLTSGLINIKRKEGISKLEARFKADEKSKLLAVSKGFGNNVHTLNVGVDYLNSKADPRNNLENYKRLTASARYGRKFDNAHSQLKWNVNFDYSFSVDDVKEDVDVNYQNIDKYKSSFNKIGLSNRLEWVFKQKFIKSVLIHGAFNAQFDKIERTKYVSISQDMLLPNSTTEGEHDGFYLPYQYTSQLEVDGKPLSAFVKTMAVFAPKVGNVNNQLKVGGDWQWSKNYGKGQVYDVMRPPFTSLTTRPRPYNDVPAESNLSFFIEDDARIPVGLNQLRVVAGLRTVNMLNLDSRYKLNGKMFFDPRINIQWTFPGIKIGGDELKTSVAGGVGWHTKLPTLTQLYPNQKYTDIIQLNYFHVNPNLRRINFVTYITDPTNYNLDAARNRKWEVRAEVEYKRNRLSVTYFNEDLSSGFQAMSRYEAFGYKKYDYSGVDHNNITEPPSLEGMPYENKKIFKSYSSTYNSATILKEGIEFQFTSVRIPAIQTRVTINGAWFKTTYKNNQPVLYHPTVIIDNEQYPYVGVYNFSDGWERQQFNTNFMFDTYIKALDFEFSTAVQCMWFTKRYELYNNPVPLQYIDFDGKVHPYTAADQNDKILQHLVRSVTNLREDKPILIYVNFKATKVFAKKYRVSLFVNKMLDYAPDYKIMGGQTRRRNVSPYFGMEINFTI